MGKKALGTGHRALGGKGLVSRGISGRFGARRVLAACVVLALASCPVVMTGCDPARVNSPFTGQPATAEEIQRQAERAARDAADKAKAQAETMAANLRAESEQAAIDAARRKAAFDRAVTELDADTRVRLASLQAEYEISGQETAARLSRMASDTERAVATLNANAAARIDAAKADADAAIAEIARRTEAAQFGVNAAASVAGLVPGWGGVAGALVTGLGGLWLGGSRKRKAADEAWDEAWARANEARNVADTHYDAGKTESALSGVLAALVSRSLSAPGIPGTPGTLVAAAPHGSGERAGGPAAAG